MKLKVPPALPIRGIMQFHLQVRRREPCAGKLRVLHLSLNTPVVAIADFPVGPAQAGVSLWEEGDGNVRLEIAVRAVRTGQLLFYAADRAEAVAADAVHAVEAALSFAEGMGFLFDDDAVAAHGQEGSRAVAALWHELVAESPEAPVHRVAPETGPALELEVPVGHGARPAEPITVRCEPLEAGADGGPAAGPEAACRVLSKFRLVLGAARASRRAGQAELGGGGADAPLAVADAELRIRLLSGF